MPQGERQDYAMRLAMKTLNRAILGAHRIASALLLSGFVLCNFGAQADVPTKIGVWSVAYLEAGNLNGCGAAAQFPDQTIFKMVHIQGGTDKAWIIVLSNPRWNAWIGKRKEHRLLVVTDWPTTKPWPYTFSTSGDSKTLSTTTSVEFMNSLADASKVEIKDDNGALLTTVDMKDSAATIRAIVTCVRDHPPKSSEPEKILTGTGFFVAQNRVVTNNHVVSGCTKDIHVRYPNREAYTATISGQDATNDLVLLHTNMDSLSTAAFYPRPRVGDQVATYGFPRSDILSSSGNCTLGNVTSLTGMRDDTRFLQMSTPVQPGNSGGALLDMSGSVVGVVVTQLSALQNVNFAIQPSMVINFLEAKDVTPKLDTPKAPRTPTEVCEIAKKFTIQVYCQGISPKTATGTAGTLSPSDVANFATKFDVPPMPGQGSTRP
jgi:serine protease Do